MRRVQPVPRSSDRAHTRAIKRRPRLHAAARLWPIFNRRQNRRATGWNIGEQMTRNGAVATFDRAQKLKRVSRSRGGKSKSVRRTGINVTSSGDNAASTFPEHFPVYRRLLTDAAVGQCSACRQPPDVRLDSRQIVAGYRHPNRA